MSSRPATVWVITCDAGDCSRLAVPAELASWNRDAHRRALHLSHAVDAFAAAHEAGWVAEMQGYAKWAHYCPDHADVPERPQSIREKKPEGPWQLDRGRDTPVHRRPESTIVDAPLPTSDH